LTGSHTHLNIVKTHSHWETAREWTERNGEIERKEESRLETAMKIPSMDNALGV
jgi:hypothetical protein